MVSPSPISDLWDLLSLICHGRDAWGALHISLSFRRDWLSSGFPLRLRIVNNPLDQMSININWAGIEIFDARLFVIRLLLSLVIQFHPR